MAGRLRRGLPAPPNVPSDARSMIPPMTCRDPLARSPAARWRVASVLLLLATSWPGDGAAAAPPATAASGGMATIVRVRQIEPRRVTRCDDPLPVVPVAPRPAVAPEVAGAAAAAAMGSRAAVPDAASATATGASTATTGATARPAGSNVRAVAAATAAAIIAADAIQQVPPATNAPGARNCVTMLVPPVTQWRVEYFRAGRYHRAWFADMPAPDLPLAALLAATEADPR